MRVEDLERELRGERPQLDREFARKLDEWAAAGFPPSGGPHARRSAAARVRVQGHRLRERLAATPPRRYLAPAGATMLVAVAIGVSQVGGLGGSDGDDEVVNTAREATDKPTLNLYSDDEPAAASAEALKDRAVVAPDTGGGGIARSTDERLEDRTARLSLGAEANEVQEVANGVIEVTDRHGGIVADSQVTSDQGGARASFELEIPAAKLDQALSDLSGLADVISRTEASEDITAQAVRAHRNLANTLEEIRRLQIELIEADTFEDRRIIRAQIASLKARADLFEAEESRTLRQARFATVAVTVTSEGPATDDGWGLGDALDDAGEILTTLGGVALIALAIAVPLALVAAVAYWIVTSARRRSREQALDG